MPTPRFHPLIRLLICTFGVFCIYVIVNTVISAGQYVAAVMTHRSPAELAARFNDTNPALTTLFFYPPILLWLWACRRLMDNQSLISLGWRRPQWVVNLLGGCVVGGTAVTFIVALLYTTGNLSFGGWSPSAFIDPPERTAATLARWLVVFIMVGFMEEIAFRGYIFHNLAARFKLRHAVFLQAIPFALIHLVIIASPVAEAVEKSSHYQEFVWSDDVRALVFDTLRSMPNLVLIGVFFALSYLKTGSMWFPFGFHAIWNFLLGSIYSIPVSGNEVPHLLQANLGPNVVLTGGSFGAEGSLLLSGILVLMIYVLTRFPDHPQARLDLSRLRPGGAMAARPEDSPDYQRPKFKTRFGTGRGHEDVAHIHLPPVTSPLESPLARPEAVTLTDGVADAYKADATETLPELVTLEPDPRDEAPREFIPTRSVPITAPVGEVRAATEDDAAYPPPTTVASPITAPSDSKPPAVPSPAPERHAAMTDTAPPPPPKKSSGPRW